MSELVVIGGESRRWDIAVEFAKETAIQVVEAVLAEFNRPGITTARAHGNINVDNIFRNTPDTRAMINRVFSSVFTTRFAEYEWKMQCDEENNSLQSIINDYLIITVDVRKR